MSEAEPVEQNEDFGLPVELQTDPEDSRALMSALSAPGFIEEFTKGVEAFKVFQALCFKLTHEAHWLNQGTAEKPSYYLQAPGAEAIMAPLGIQHQPPKKYRIDRENERGKYYIWTFEGEAYSAMVRRGGFFIGAAHSQDGFLSSRPGFDPERDEADIIKKAMSNWEVNVVGRLGGLRRPSKEMLIAGGLNPDKIEIVDYSGNRSEKQGGSVISEPQGKRLYAIGKNIEQDRVKAYLAFRGYESSKDILRRDYDSIVKWAQDGGPDWEKPAQRPQPNGQPTEGELRMREQKERQREASEKPRQVVKVSPEQVEEIKKEASKKGIQESALNDFLKSEWKCLLNSVPAAMFDKLIKDIKEDQVTAWLELGSDSEEKEPGSEG